MKRKARYKNENQIPVNKPNWYNNSDGYEEAPEYYYDLEFTCNDCGSKETWTKEQQKIWYEKIRPNPNAKVPNRCRLCRTHIEAIKEDQKRHMEKMNKKEPHPNEKFFKKNT